MPDYATIAVGCSLAAILCIVVQFWIKRTLPIRQYNYFRDLLLLGIWMLLAIWFGSPYSRAVAAAAAVAGVVGLAGTLYHRRRWDLCFFLIGVLCALWGPSIHYIRFSDGDYIYLEPSASFALPVLAVGSLPWTGFLLRAAAASWPRSGEDLLNPEGPRLLLLTGAGVFLLFGVFMGDALTLVSCLAPLAALTGDCIDEWLEKDRVRVLQGAVALNLICLLLALTVGLLLLLGAFPVLSSALLSIVPWAVFLVLFGAASWYYARTRQPSKMMRNLSAAAMLALLPLAGVFDLLAENTSVREAGLAIGNVDRCVLAQYVMNRPSLFFYTLKDSVSVNGPLMPGFAEQKVENDTALHLLWEGKERVLLLVGSEQQLLAPLPQEVNVLYDAGKVMVLSNRKPPLHADAPRPASSVDIEPAEPY